MLSFDALVKKVFGSRSDRWLKKQAPLVARINELEPKIKALSEADLRGMTARFRGRIDQGASLDDLLPEVFAVVREVAWRTMSMRHFDVQLLGGIVLHRGMVAEMKTGEGKTLTATLPVYLNALSGKGAHVVTVNDYLASRDADWMGRIYGYLGLSVGKILSMERQGSIKQAAYRADITYGTNNEFGFDYLRDNMKFRIEDYVQRGHNFAIVDEVDSILIDEARTPLIITGEARQDVSRYVVIDAVVPTLQAEIDYTVDEKAKGVSLTDAGVDKVEARLQIDNLYDVQNMELLHHVNQALRAHTIFRRDRDYVVQGSKVIIVDENTGRLMQGRRWSDGLHQAVEAKEKVPVQHESQTYATITFQNYFRMYSKLAGMTGTAETEEEEFQKIYNLDVVVVPTNRPVLRQDFDDMVYKTQSEKYRAVLDEIEKVHAKGQPILVGTVSVEKSEIVSRLLRQRGIPHEVLNARNHAREAEIVAQAGRRGAITISTNMAGRGTDIKLGGDPDAMALRDLRATFGDRAHEHTQPEAFAAILERYRPECEAEKREVLAAGGLHIIGTERHESRRIDNQLRGRSGRQGDPGSSRFYMALEDDLLRIFQGDKLVGWMERMGLQDDEAIEHRWINKSIEDAQRRVEAHNFNIRKNLLEYDDVMNLQRRSVYEMRRRALMGEKIREMIIEALQALVDDILGECCKEGTHPESWDIPGLRERLDRIYGIQMPEADDLIRDMAWEELRGRMLDDTLAAYEAREAALGTETARLMERDLLLKVTDQHWKDHLLAMDRLRDGISLRGYGQRNPLLEFKKEGTDMFRLMCSLRDEAVITALLRSPPEELAEPEEQAPEEPVAKPPAQPRLTMAEVKQRLAQIQAMRAAALAEAAAAAADDSDDSDDFDSDDDSGGSDETTDEAADSDPATDESEAVEAASEAEESSADSDPNEGLVEGTDGIEVTLTDDMDPINAPTQVLSAEAIQPRAPRRLGTPEAEPEPQPVVEASPPEEPSAPAEPPPPANPAPGAEARTYAAYYGIRRNEPCPCGSGKKFKKCCASEDGEA